MNSPSKALLGLVVLALCCMQISCDRQSAAGTAEPTGSIRITVGGMVCVNCVRNLQHHFAELEQVRQVFVSLPHKEMLLELAPGQEMTDQQLTDEVKQAGYEAKGILRSTTPFAADKEKLETAHER